jgi:hypothetical protein
MAAAMSDDITQRLDRLEAVEGVRLLLARYAIASDSLLAGNLVELFTEDVVLRNPAEYHGRDAVLQYYDGVLSTLISGRHHIVNSTIEIEAPDRARHRGYFLAFLFRATEALIVFGNYDDVVVRGADGAWRFQEKGNYAAGTAPLPTGAPAPTPTLTTD